MANNNTDPQNETIEPASNGFARACQKHPYLSIIGTAAIAGSLVAAYNIWTDQENFQAFSTASEISVTDVSDTQRIVNADGTVYLFENGEYCLLPTIPREDNFRSGRDVSSDISSEESALGTIASTLRGETVVGEKLADNALELFKAQINSPLACPQ